MPKVAEVKERFKGISGHIAVAIWQEDDVLERAKFHSIKCSQEEAAEILDEIDQKQDCELGITWITIDYFLEQLQNARCE